MRKYIGLLTSTQLQANKIEMKNNTRVKGGCQGRAYTLEVADTREPLLVPKRSLILDDYKWKTKLSLQIIRVNIYFITQIQDFKLKDLLVI